MTTPFARVSVRVFDHLPAIGPIGLTVYVGLSKYADNLTRVCFPHQTTLAALLGLSRQAVNAAILRLEACGLIAIERRAGRGHVYRLLDTEPAPSPCPLPLGEGSHEVAPTPSEPVEEPTCPPAPTGGVNQADSNNYTALTRLKNQLQQPVVVVPPCLQNLDVAQILGQVPVADRQGVLDAYAARHAWGKLNGAPVALPAAMLRALVKQYQAGTLDTAQAVKVAAKRQVSRPPIPPPRPLSAPASRDAALAALHGARAALGGIFRAGA